MLQAPSRSASLSHFNKLFEPLLARLERGSVRGFFGPVFYVALLMPFYRSHFALGRAYVPVDDDFQKAVFADFGNS